MEFVKKLHEFARENNVDINISVSSIIYGLFYVRMSRGTYAVTRGLSYGHTTAETDVIDRILTEMLAEVNKNR